MSSQKSTGGQQQRYVLPKPAHSISSEDLLQRLEVDGLDGLSTAEAEQRLATHGRNQIGGDPGASPLKIFLRQIANAMVLVLILAMIVSFAIGSWIEAGVVAFVIIVNVVIGFYQDLNAEKTMVGLQSLSSPTARVVRDGSSVILPATDVVPGDLIELNLGDTVPADIRLVETMNLESDEALLTGESLPVAKDANLKLEEDTGPGDRLNVAFASSSVTAGRGRGVVFATGMSTEIGKIAASLSKKKSAVRPVKRRADGTIHPLRRVESWSLTVTDAAGRFLGVNVGTPLQKKLSRLAMLLFGIAVVCAIIVLAANGFSNRTEVIIYAVATGLSMIPASLIIVLTVTMAMGTKQMVARHVIVRNTQSLEALGAVTDICSDKTGTLTQGRMTANAWWGPEFGMYKMSNTNDPFDPTLGELSWTKDLEFKTDRESTDFDTAIADNTALKEFLLVASLANIAEVHQDGDGKWHARGDPTEIALQVLATRFDLNRTRMESGEKPLYRLKDEFPFDSTIKKMSVICTNITTGADHVYTKGAVERVLDSCVYFSNDSTKLTTADQKIIYDAVDTMTSQGLRVLALASRPLHSLSPSRDEVESSLIFRGLVGLYDPPRPESLDAVRRCHAAGIQVRMVTGDHPGTARAIAAEIGILPDPKVANAKTMAGAVMTAKEFDKLTDEEIDALPRLPLVIARCAPDTKVRMIEALRRRGAFMAMTGDGVNDSPSLKIADVGIAMGKTGSDVAKEVSDLVLADDNFASIVNAVEEGRRIFDNIQKFILHLLAQNIAQAFTLLVGLAFKDSAGISVFPLAPVEIMWIIMITSGVPDMGLGMEVAAPDILQRPPHDLKRGVFSLELMCDMLVYGLWMSALCISSFVLVMFGFGDGNFGDDCNIAYSDRCDTVFRARATTFVSMTWFALFLAWEMVDMRRSFFHMEFDSERWFALWARGIWRNKVLFWAIMAGFLTVFPTLYIPVINRDVFKHEGISWEWGIVFIEAMLFFLGVEAWKWAKRVYFRRHPIPTDDAADDDGDRLQVQTWSQGEVKPPSEDEAEKGGADAGRGR